ncbi:MAG: NifU N-terminal domain-containing protein, partial [Leeuwenhoekiella sp.]
MSTYSISIAPTSNDAIKKFEADSFLVKHESFEFKNIDEAANSPLAQQLFYLPFVKTVYISQNFIAVEKYNIVDWIDIQDELAKQIED